MADIISFADRANAPSKVPKQESRQPTSDLVYPSRKLYQRLLLSKNVPIDEDDGKPNGYCDDDFAERVSALLDEYDHTVIDVLGTVKEGLLPDNIQFRMQRDDVARFITEEKLVCVEYIAKDKEADTTYRLAVSPKSGVSICRRKGTPAKRGRKTKNLSVPELLIRDRKGDRWEKDENIVKVEETLKTDEYGSRFLCTLYDTLCASDISTNADAILQAYEESKELISLWLLLLGRAKLEFTLEDNSSITKEMEVCHTFSIALVPADDNCRGSKVRLVAGKNGSKCFAVYTYFNKSDDLYLHNLRRRGKDWRWCDEWEEYEKERELRYFEHEVFNTSSKTQVLDYLRDLWGYYPTITFHFPLTLWAYADAKDPYEKILQRTKPFPTVSKKKEQELGEEQAAEIRMLGEIAKEDKARELNILKEFFKE